jgi:hypothetical protein
LGCAAIGSCIASNGEFNYIKNIKGTSFSRVLPVKIDGVILPARITFYIRGKGWGFCSSPLGTSELDNETIRDIESFLHSKLWSGDHYNIPSRELFYSYGEGADCKGAKISVTDVEILDFEQYKQILSERLKHSSNKEAAKELKEGIIGGVILHHLLK